GALARTNLKFDDLHTDAKGLAAGVGFVPSRNPFQNTLAQAVEIAHCVSECIELLESLPEERPWVDLRFRDGEGSALTEAPRGLLYHSYAVNRRGVVERADIVTPTAHNFMSLEENLGKLVRENAGKPADELRLLCEMLVRAYDPCFSCSVH
ncbi:MAG: nickel-dependent hydrogenase large subunit, partial [Nitrospirota bacterium]